ncbi:MAG: polysaccharide deacetylase family protein [Gammaproteobacteria bacterium]|jgi:peptidoglycan/xylan/chitin deacetylase (PgdA/CDA1 family)
MHKILGIILALSLFCGIAFADNSTQVPILTYHNFDPSVPGSMTENTTRFEEQLKWLKDNGYTVIPLKQLVSYLQGKTATLPAKSVVITVDDGKESVYKYMYPIIKQYNIPVTLFIYPSAISNASYAMTWDQLRELQKTGMFDIQSHTYWHPNFKQDKKKMTPADYQKDLDIQLVKSKKVLEEKMGTSITLLAWPYGIYDPELEQAAKNAGYEMAFSIDGRPANRSENAMSQPRYLIVESEDMKTFAAIMQGQTKGMKQSEG